MALLCVLLALWAALHPAPAAADYRNPRLTGNSSWQPGFLRVDQSLVTLLGDRPQGRLKGSTKVREEVEVDLERRVIVAQRRYGEVLIAPEFVEDLTTATLAAAQAAGRERWVKMVTDRSLRPPTARDGEMLEIEIPVDFPDAVADIIGQGARLNLRGSERISFSGTSTILQGGPQYESGNPSIFPDLDMRQQLRVNLDGTIGTKIHVLVNHDSEVDTDFENKIQLRYDGDDDEVVQKIEMGNTDLSLPGAEFLSFRKSQQGLFGAKAVAKMGPLDLTVIASKQEGKTASQTFVGQARRDSVVVRDWEYVKRTYYWVSHPIDLATSIAADGSGILPITDFELFLDDKRPQNDIADGAKLGFAYVDPDVGTPADSIGVVRGTFHRLTENQDYTIDRQTGVLTLERPVGRDEVVAMWYVRDDGTEAGHIAATDTLSLALLAPPERDLYEPIDPSLSPEARALHFSVLQIREQKNVYSFGARNIDPASFEMRILKKASAAGQENEDAQADSTGAETEYIKILGLDYRGETTPEPDLRVEPQYVDFEDGTITFPNITPFAPDSSVFDTGEGRFALNVIVSPSVVSTGRTNALGVEKEGAELAERNPGIYTLEPDDLFNREKYLLEIKFTTPTPSYNLNRFNILDGSETVRLNGRTLTRGVDYDIDYDFGILTFRTDEAAAADAEVSVDFEFVPLFGQAKESLVGVSGTYNFNTRTRVSTSWLFFTRATPEERPRLGQEPTRILVGNMYGQWASAAPFLSGLVNKIPLVRTEAGSDLQLQGEVALSIPNPNTKNQIYIDDMEGVEDSRELSITRGVWSPASEPAGPTALGLDRDMIRPQPYNWYNPENVVRRQDVFIELADEREGQEFLQVLEFRYRDEVSPDSTGWMGIMRNLSTIGEDYSEKKFLEVWVNDFGVAEGRMIVDMGEISEDFYVRDHPLNPEKGRNFLDTEDFDPYDGALTVSKEDLGLDNVKGVDEDNVEGDDGDDDFFFRRTQTPDYSKINNFEGNSLLDTEDLDGDNLLDQDDAYLSYVFDLSNTAAGEGAVAQSNFDPGIRPNNHWRLYRIRLDRGEAVGGVPRLKSVKYLRVWFDGIGGGPGPKVQVASVKIVGASWLEERLSTNDTVEPLPDGTTTDGEFAISTLSNKEDADY
ncbi:cell surface protein SprA, partial [bacterium]|nr:cell surface protein SprA [bacterium]